MPFTPTHALAVVPIARFWSGGGVVPALVIGSMVPDWPLYVPWGPRYDLTHSLAGIFLACLPIGFTMTVFYQLVLKDALFELLPVAMKKRLAMHMASFPLFAPGPLLAIAAAVAVGAATHVGWDGFTHRGQWGVNLVPWLSEPIMLSPGISLPAYSVLQHGSTLFGLPIFVLLFASWYRASEQRAPGSPRLGPAMRTFWLLALTVVPLGLLIKMGFDVGAAATRMDVFRALFFGVTRSGLAVMISLLCYGLFFGWLSRTARVRQ